MAPKAFALLTTRNTVNPMYSPKGGIDPATLLTTRNTVNPMYSPKGGIDPARGRNGTEGRGTGQKAKGTAVMAEHSGSKFAAA